MSESIPKILGCEGCGGVARGAVVSGSGFSLEPIIPFLLLVGFQHF